MLAWLRSSDATTRWWIALGGAGAIVGMGLVTASPGNDLDVANVFRSGRSIVRHLDYTPSRPPGAPVHETIIGAADLIGGAWLAAAMSIVAAAAMLWTLDALLRFDGVGRGGRWAVVLVGANPWFLIAATSAADYVFALAFALGSALNLRAGRPIVAGLLAAAAMGSRVGTITVLIAIVVAELGNGRTARRPTLLAAGVAAVATALVFIPSILEAGGISFAQNDFSASTPLVQLGRAAAKDLLLVGLPTAIVLAIALPAVIAVLRDWSTSWAVRFAMVGLVGSQLLFLRFPWKMAHLLPSLVCLAVLYGVALADRPRLLIAAVALQVAFAVVRFDVIEPDDPNAATGGRFGPSVTWGPVITDWQCRLDHPRAYLGRQKAEVEPAWDCAAPFAR